MTINDTLCCLGAGLPMPLRIKAEQGDYKGAIALIDELLADDTLTKTMRFNLIARREMFARYPDAYPYSKAQALEMIKKTVPEYTDRELTDAIEARLFDAAMVDGEVHVLDSFLETLSERNPAFIAREQQNGADKSDGSGRKNRTAAMDEMEAQGYAARRIHLRATIRLKDEHFTPGMFLRAHLPIPAACDTQSDIEIIALSPAGGQIAPASAPQRTVCWEGNFDENPTFTVEYRYIHREPYHDPDTLVCDNACPAMCTEEQMPHIAFTPYLRQVADELTAGAKTPLEKAWRLYDFISKNMHYSYQPPYILMEQIPEKCLRDYTGDCGVFALTYITMLRYCGIPAEWQSGLAGLDRHAGSHDWARIYLAPYGWLQTDVTWGMSAGKNGLERLRRFYFCNVDASRMVANNAFRAHFTIEKKYWRDDPYDNQRGELESAARGYTEKDYDTEQLVLACEKV